MGARPSKLLWVFFLAYFTFGMMYVLGALTPDVIAEYSLSRFAAGLLGSAFYFAYTLCAIPTGLLMDRLGGRLLILSGVFLMGLGCLVVSRAHSYPLILAMVFAVGVGVTMLQTSGNPLIKQLNIPANYDRNLTITIGFAGFGPFFAPFVLAYIRSTGRPWQALYLFFAFFCLGVLILLAVSKFPPRVQSSDRMQLGKVGQLLRNPLIIAYMFGIFFYVAAEVGTAFWIPKFFEDVHGVPAAVTASNAASLFARAFPSLPAFIFALFWGLQGTGQAGERRRVKEIRKPEYSPRFFGHGARLPAGCDLRVEDPDRGGICRLWFLHFGVVHPDLQRYDQQFCGESRHHLRAAVHGGLGRRADSSARRLSGRSSWHAHGHAGPRAVFCLRGGPGLLGPR